jgi:hypothetical protein
MTVIRFVLQIPGILTLLCGVFMLRPLVLPSPARWGPRCFAHPTSVRARSASRRYGRSTSDRGWLRRNSHALRLGTALAARGGEAAARERLEAARTIGEQLGAGLRLEKANEALIGLGERPVALQEEEG